MIARPLPFTKLNTVYKLLTLLLLANLLTPFAQARGTRKKRPRRARVAAPVAVFQPSPEVEMKLQQELERALATLVRLEPGSLLANPYVVQAIYFSDGFVRDHAADRPNVDPTLRISAQLCRQLTPERKAEYLRLLREVYADDLADVPAGPLTAPVPVAEPGRWSRRRTHTDAVDLFTPEGTPVLSASRGVVVLAESGWSPDDWFSTSSAKGGNTVIVFDPGSDRFYRYAHLESVQVNPGTLVEPGQPLGSVGHSGRNAARPGHGGHLHFEINQHENGSMRAWSADRLWTVLQRSQPPLVNLAAAGN